MRVRASNVPVSLDAMLPAHEKQLKREAARACGLQARDIEGMRIVRKSIDARKKQNVHFVLTCELGISPGVKLRPAKGVAVVACETDSRDSNEARAQLAQSLRTDVSRETSSSAIGDAEARPVVIGAGPAGLFCALYLAETGMHPLLVERGEAVEDRQRTIEAFNKGGELDRNSNIQFGEGGAGTFSDGKLTTGTKDPRIKTVLETFAECGAPADILIDAKPHIGTDYLPSVVRNLRQKIIDAGGEVRFGTQLIGIEFADEQWCATDSAQAAKASDGWAPTVSRAPAPQDRSAINDDQLGRARMHAAILEDVDTGQTTKALTNALVLAIGHSARDTFEMLHASGLAMERKPFAMGVRVEHLQEDIDRAQYGKAAGHPALPPADYKLNVRTENGRGVYTFCMCPGGTVVAAASEPGGVCVNGMSSFARDGKNANSALLVEIRPDDLPGEDVLAGMYFQRELEQAAYRAGCGDAGSEPANGRAYRAPSQTVGSFLGNADGLCSCKTSAGCAGAGSGKVQPTYPRGVTPFDLHDCLPSLITDALEEALVKLDRKLHGFADPQAVMTAVEARSSSPIRILRDPQTLQSISALGVYPTGEGAGYAGGITSAAVDGIRVAEAVMQARCAGGSARAAMHHEDDVRTCDNASGTCVSEHADNAHACQRANDTSLYESAPSVRMHEDMTAVRTCTNAAAADLTRTDVSRETCSAAEALRQGRPVIFPTDTVMGIGVSIEAAESPSVLADIKGRPQDKPIAWLVGGLDALDIYGVDVPEYAYQLAREKWPGALTLIVKASQRVPERFQSAEGTIGLRMPDSEIALQLIREAGSPLAATSANLAGEPAPAAVDDLSDGFLQRAEEHDIYILVRSDSERPTSSPSTVIDCTGEQPRIVRM